MGLLSIFENVEGTARPLWRDVSRHQGQVDYGVSALNGVLGVVSRAGISWGYQDSWFPRNWEEPANFGLYRSSYHVIYAGQSVQRQADNWYKVHPEIDIIPRVIDLEVDMGVSSSQVASDVWAMSEVVLARDGVRPIIYSRYSLVNKWLADWTDSMLNSHRWWLAQYLWTASIEHAGPPTLPHRILEENVILHQTADKKPGFDGECESYSIDYDRWELGNEIEMHEYIALVWGGEPPPEPPPPDCDLEQIYARLDVIDAQLDQQDEAITILREDLDAHEHDHPEIGYVEVTAHNVGKARVNLVHDRIENASGFPVWTIEEPRVQYENGTTIRIIDGRVRGDGEKYACAVHETGLFVLEEDFDR